MHLNPVSPADEIAIADATVDDGPGRGILNAL